MLVIYNKQTGILSQAVTQTADEETMQRIKAQHISKGMGVLEIERRDIDLLGVYVKDGELVDRPRVIVSAPEQSNSGDDVEVAVSVPVRAVIFFNGQKIVEEDLTDGIILPGNVSGKYYLLLLPSDPYQQTVVEIEIK